MSGNKFTELPKVEPAIINKYPEGERMTVILIGMGRGGTSMTAGILDALGVAMDGSNEGHFERMEFKRRKSIIDIVHTLNKEYKKWGAQVLIDDFQIDRMIQTVINPVFIVIFRDPISIAQRRVSANDYYDGCTFDSALNATLYEYDSLNQTMIKYKYLYPTLFLSYEKLKYEPDQIDIICKFLDLPLENKQKALDRIGSGYLIQ